PHARGDDVMTTSGSDLPSGTPPRAWGRLLMGAGRQTALRYTPTRVGTTRQAVHHGSVAVVHPHARGDDDAIMDTTTDAPVHPHARGDDSAAPHKSAAHG